MSGASRHWPDVREVMAMELLSCRITGTEIRDRQNIHHMLDTVSLVVHCVTYRISTSAGTFCAAEYQVLTG